MWSLNNIKFCQSKTLIVLIGTMKSCFRAVMFADSGTESSINLNVRVFACRSQTLCARHCGRTTRSLAIQTTFQNKSVNNTKYYTTPIVTIADCQRAI